MPRYKTHVALNTLVALPLCLVLGYYTLHSPTKDLLIFTSTFLYTTLFMNPDMDVARRLKWYSLRGLLALPFRSYSTLFRHRGLSHSLLWGSLTRIVWLTAFFVLIVCAFGYFSFPHQRLWDDLIRYKMEILYGFAGIFLADAAHLFLDKVSS